MSNAIHRIGELGCALILGMVFVFCIMAAWLSADQQISYLDALLHILTAR